MLKIINLRKTYGKNHALDGLDMTIPEGALYGFVGPNGAGKTTTIKIMTGLLEADEGQVIIGGQDVTGGLNERKRSIGYVPDFFGVYDNLKVSEYMEFFASCYGISGLSAAKCCQTLLEQVGLEDKEEFYVDSLSRGMKQRLCLARALIHDPALLVMDEPTSGLDPRTRFEFKEILKELKDQGKTILISSHILSELSELCTDIGIIDQGKMVLSGSMEEILRRVNTSNPLIISILGEKDGALSVLKSHTHVQTISVKEGNIMVNFNGDQDEEAGLLRQLIESGVKVRGFMREAGSLESLFMQITDHDIEKAVLVHENESGL
ncbi:MAG TPA: ABC transporter ATP-binding protein [Candidatus Hungatella pullicola]|nr:ABC transporter ATP-binding protein [Candidatus Hungatella pullicola]